MTLPSDSPGCPFCQDSVKSFIFYESENFLALYNIAPVLPGHSLVIPRLHHTSLLTLTDQRLAELFNTARKALYILMEAFQTRAFDWSIQEKKEAGQTIEHLHLHIVPRIQDDLIKPGYWYPLILKNDLDIIDSEYRPRLTSKELKIIVEKLKDLGRNMYL